MEEDRRAGDDARLRAAGELNARLLDALAAAYGVATGYEAADQRWRPAPEASVRAALRVMGVDCESGTDITRSLREVEEAPWRRVAPACTVLRTSQAPQVPLRIPVGVEVDVRVHTEDGATLTVAQPPSPTGRGRSLSDGSERMETVVRLPDGLPLGYHRVEVTPQAGEPVSGHLVVVPDRCPDPGRLGRTWGWMLQLYALRSEGSWGLGDLADLRELLRWSADLGADFAVVNPLHAAAPTRPQENSPYYPSSRRFTNPIYIAVAEVAEIEGLDGGDRERVEALGRQARAQLATDRIDRDAAFAAKQEALEIAFAAMPPARVEALHAYRRRQGAGLEDFATFCTLAERHGLPFQSWPTDVRHPRSPGVTAFRREHAERIAYHAWLQMLCDEQLAATQQGAVEAGLRIGVIGDLAVGVDKGGADAWALQDELGLGVTVGAPPDAFNQQGQDWQQPPLLPNRLRASGYAPLREMLGAVLRHSGGIRIDHVIGLFRLFWVPEGAPPVDGTYVRYPADELLGVLSLEAHRADAIVVGEDLGTVEAGVREKLNERRVLSSSVLYFERDGADGRLPRQASDYPRHALASVTTHDLPTAAGWWTDEEVSLRVKLGLLGEGTSEHAEVATKAEDRSRMERLLHQVGFLGADATVEERIVAMHAFLARTPALLFAISLSDVVGDLRQPNLPGTVDEYPNWRLPLAEPNHDEHCPVTLERLRTHPGVHTLLEAVREQGRGH